MRKREISVIGMLLVSMSGYSAVIYTEDFSGYAIGAQPTNMTAKLGALIVNGSGTTGSGNAVQLTDSSASSAAYMERNFAASEAGEYGAVSISFDLYNNQLASSAQNITFGIGSYSNNATYTMNANPTRYFNLEFSSATNTLTFRASTNVNLGTTSYNLGSANHIEVFVNDSETDGVGYIGGTLGTNSFAVYVNSSLVLVKGLGTNSACVVGESDGLGRFGFYSGSTGIDQFTIDNIVVNNLIPEPASIGLLLIGGVTVLFLRRRNR